MIKFKSGSAFSLLRRAVAFIVQQNDDVVGKWHGIDVLKDLCNMVAGYNENSADMRGVDVPMIEDAFVTKPPGGTCISFEDMTGDDIGYFLHLKLEQNGKAVQIACSQSRDASLIINVGGTPIDKFGINDTTELWLHSKHRLAQLLRQRKKEDDKIIQKQSGRDETKKLHEVSTTKTVRPGSTSGRTPKPKRLKEGEEDDEDEDDTPMAMRALFQSASRGQIIDEDNKIDDNVIDKMVDALHTRFKNKEKELTPQEERLVGALLKVSFGYSKPDVVEKRSFFAFKHDKHTVNIARIPKQQKDQHSRRSQRRHRTVANQWFALLDGTSFSHQFVLSQIEEAPDNKKREYSIKASRRATVEETAIVQHYTASSDNKMKKFSRAWFCTFGWRPFAPIHEQKEFKNSFLEDQYKTKQFLIITLQRNIKSSIQGSTELRRDVDVMVTHVSIAENALCFAQGLMESMTLLPSQGLFGVPFTVNGEFEDVILYKLSIDAGNKSTKLLLSIINRKKPQSQDNVKFCVEMAGVKDDPHNLANAVFTNKYGNMKSEFEAVLNRRTVTLQIEANTQTPTRETQAVFAINLDNNHNIYHPRPLPAISGVTEAQADLEDENKIGIVSVDFSIVDKVMVLKKDKALIGLSFFNSAGECIKSVHFRQSIEVNNPDTVPLKSRQYVNAGVFTADMDMLSTFIGHQGACATWPCIWKLIRLSELKQMWEEERDRGYMRRSPQRIKKWAKLFHDEFESLAEYLQVKKTKTKLTQTKTYSIIRDMLADIPFDTILFATLHVRLGVTKSLVNFLFDFFQCVEDLDSGASLGSRNAIEREIKNLGEYKAWLDSELGELQKAIEGQDTLTAAILERIAYAKGIVEMEGRISTAYVEKYKDVLNQAKEQLRQIRDGEYLSDQEKSQQIPLIEQSCLTAKTISHLTNLHKKFDTRSRRIIVTALKKYGVDIQVYFNGVINGPHCLKFVDNGIKILKHIKQEMMSIVTDEAMKSAMSTFVDKFEVILRHMQCVQKQLMSTHAQDVKVFKENRDNLRRALVDLVRWSEVTFLDDNKLSLPSTLKCLSLFDDDMIDLQFANWKNTGALDEQNNESAHAEMNNIQTLFGASRGANQKKMMINRLLLRCNPELTSGIDTLLAQTQMSEEEKEKRKQAREQRKAQEEMDASNEDMNEQVEADGGVEEDVDEEDYSRVLHDNETAMNENDRLRIPEDFEHEDMEMAEELRSMDTKLYVCTKCTPRHVYVGKNALKIHIQECHDGNIQAEHDAIDGRIT